MKIVNIIFNWWCLSNSLWVQFALNYYQGFFNILLNEFSDLIE
jgi:hypothetical protein